MAKKYFTLPWTMQELKNFCDGILSLFSGTFLSWIQRMKTKPFVIVVDEEQKCKRIFFTKEDANTFFQARANKEMTDEIAALDFTGGTIPGDEQFKMVFNVLNVDDASTYGSQAKLRFSFSTADTLNNNRPTEETIEVFFTFTSDLGTKTDTKRFPYSNDVTEFDITEYLEPGENTIIMVVTGISSGLTLTTKATYTSVYLPFSSTFDISADRNVGVNFGIPYTISGIGSKEVEFVIDGTTKFNEDVYDGTASKTYTFRNTLAAGIHSLQMKAYTTVNNVKYESNMLFFQFVVNGPDLNLTATLIKAVFPSGTSYFLERTPGLLGEQYVDYSLDWAYFSTADPKATVIWKTKLNGVETVIGSREIDEMLGTVGTMPDPVKFQPDTVGVYDIYSYIKGHESTHIGDYTINVSANSAGLREATGYTMKLTAKGRSNNEPAETLTDFSDNGYTTSFNDKMTFDGLAGYTGDALRFDNGATGVNTCKPFAVENSTLTNGCAVVFHFKTRNVEDENIPLIEIGNASAQSTAYFAIYGKRVLFRPSNGVALEYEFASEEETHLAVVVHPKTGVTDAQMMFFIFNGIEAPGKAYGDTAVFNIGSYADTVTDNGKIVIGDATGKAAIDIYGIRVYNNMLSMWQGMNNYMIDHGGDVASMMKKNNIFINNDFARPNISTIKDKFRVLEIIGNLGMLESSNKKESFFGSCIYTDPNNPKFNFKREDGGAYIETAGQSRLEDLMAKSFHLDLNKNDTVATYQDGKLCHKNRFIFAEGNIPENGVRIDLSGADSSICRNASHMKMVNKYYPYILVGGEYILRTPPQQYALSGKWSEDMAAKYGGAKEDYPWPHNINFAPDSVPIVVVWHEKADDPIQVYGLAQMTEEKKASYANGNHSIHIKAPLSDGTLDPFDRFFGTADGKGWNNEGVEEIEYVNPSALTYSSSLVGFDDDATREYSFELCFPKTKDLTDGGVEVWNIFKTEYLKPLCDTYHDQDAFDDIIEDVIYMPSFAMYYNKVMDKKMNDSLCRNMHVIRYNMGTRENPKFLWWAKWWDADVCCGLFQSNAMGVDPKTDRNTKASDGKYIMAGREPDGSSMWLWDALENNDTFKSWCKLIAEASYSAGWSASSEKAMQDEITNAFSEGLYNLDGLLKYLYAYRKGNDYMVRMQGSSVPYRHGFIDASYAYRESQMAIGSYASRSASFRATNATYPCKVTITSTVEWVFGLGTTTTNIVTGVTIKPTDGEVSIQIPQGMTLGRDFLSVYGADKIRTLDMSDFAKYLSVQVNLGNLTQIQKLYIGYPTHAKLKQNGYNQDDTISFTGIDSMSRLIELSIMGLHELKQFNLSSLNHLTKFYASGSGLTNFVPANGTKFNTVELPDTLETIEASQVTLGIVSFWHATIPATVSDASASSDTPDITQMSAAPTSLLTLKLLGMGSDIGTHSLVHLWCQMLKANPTLINTAQITYNGIEWGKKDEEGEYITSPMLKEDLLVLAQIPSGQRKLTGYVYCEETFSQAEQSILISAFGENVFDYSSTSRNLVCDCAGSGISISASGDGVTSADGVVSIVQGKSAKFVGAGFPISGSSKDNYRWRVQVNGEWLVGTELMPTITFGSCTLNWKTGVLTTTENSEPTKSYTIGCYDYRTYVSGDTTATITVRIYPNTATTSLTSSQQPTTIVDGEIQITAIGSYMFTAENKRIVGGQTVSYDGTMKEENGGVWTLVNADSNYVSRNTSAESNPFIKYCLNVINLPDDDLRLTLKYKSNWKNGLQLSAADLKIAIISVIEQLLINDAIMGNPALFKAMVNLGFSHANEAYYSSLELKAANGTLDISSALGSEKTTLTSLMSGTYNVISYLKNVEGLNLTGCTGLLSFDVSNMIQLHTLNLTNLNPLCEIKADTTTIISITKGGTLPSLYVPDSLVSTYRTNAGNELIEPLSDYGQTALMWDDGTRIRFDDNSTFIL